MPPKKGRSLGISPLQREVARKAVVAAMAASAQPATEEVNMAAVMPGKFIRKNAVQTGNLGLRLEMGRNLPSAFNNTASFNYKELNAARAPNLSRNAGLKEYAERMGAGGAAAGGGGGGGGGGAAAYQYRMGLPSAGAYGGFGVGHQRALSTDMMASSTAFNPNNLMNFGEEEGGGGSKGGRRRSRKLSKRRRSRKQRR